MTNENGNGKYISWKWLVGILITFVVVYAGTFMRFGVASEKIRTVESEIVSLRGVDKEFSRDITDLKLNTALICRALAITTCKE